MLSRILLLALILTPLACRSTEPNDSPCTCGQAAADIEGCSHAKCLAGQNNPENPDCVCGTLSLKKH